MNEFSAFGARSHTLAEALDHAVFLYRRNFGRLSLIAVLAFIPAAILRLTVSLILPSAVVFDTTELFFRLLPGNKAFFTSAFFSSLLVYMGLTVVLEFLAYTLAVAVMIHLLIETLAGLPVSPWKSLAAVGRRWPQLLIIYGLKFIVAGLLLLWSMVPVVGWLMGPGAFSFFVGIVSFLGVPILVLEQRSALQSLWRAWELARRRYWWLIFFACFLFIFSQVFITNGKYLLLVLYAGIAEVVRHWLPWTPSITSTSIVAFVIDTLASLIFLPFYAVASLTAYHYLRNHTEGLDLIVATASGSPGARLTATVENSSQTTLRFRLPTLVELGKFALTTISGTVGAVVFYFILLVVFAFFGSLMNYLI